MTNGRSPRLELGARLALPVALALGIGGAILAGTPPAWMALGGGLVAGAAAALGRLGARRARRSSNWIPVHRLGSGSMGEVWRAEHRFLPRPAAIKFIRPETLGADAAGRFEREAHTTSLLTSPHTIELYDYGITDDGALSYVMEFLDGRDLDTLVERHGPLPPARVVHLLRQVCISLAEAHLQGFVHRDLKPANIYACRQGIEYDYVKVLDFGMVADRRLDEGRMILGTPAYLAPEMITGLGFDHRADIYSLGCVAYKLLTGRTVFLADSPEEMMKRHVHDRPEAPSFHTGQPIPRALDVLVLECLRKFPSTRIDSAADLSRRLAACGVTPRWTAGQAMRWWHEHEPSVAASRNGRRGVSSARDVVDPLEATVREALPAGNRSARDRREMRPAAGA